MKRKSDAGMATAEYATGMVGAIFLALILYRLGLDVMPDLMQTIFARMGEVAGGLFDRIRDYGAWAWIV